MPGEIVLDENSGAVAIVRGRKVRAEWFILPAAAWAGLALMVGPIV
jgi:hypothetical protein